ncbi:MAG: hypothetical protein Q4F13_00635 [Pseudomonadota bacterium]|nr:hypothetical protein [Pseudomonadota bacterium]
MGKVSLFMRGFFCAPALAAGAHAKRMVAIFKVAVATFDQAFSGCFGAEIGF